VRAQLRQDSLRGNWLRDRAETQAGIPKPPSGDALSA